jgi:predicted ATP-dependent protease
MARLLPPDALRAVCDPSRLGFTSTAELPAIDGIIGQDRAQSATAFGIAMRRPGYNLFVLGPARTGRTSAMRRVLARAAVDAPTPPDICYVHHFADPYRPTALELPAGRGRELASEMERLVGECKMRLPRAFEHEEFERERSRLLEQAGQRQQAEMERFQTAARDAGFAVVRTPNGLAVAPAPQGEPLSPAQFAELPEAERQAMAERGRSLEEPMEVTLRQLRALERETNDALEQLVRRVAAGAVREVVHELRTRFAGLDHVQAYLDAVEADLVQHAEEFRRLEQPAVPLPLGPPPGAFLQRYTVNVLVDRRGEHGAPVVFEDHPTYLNLMGRVEHRVHLGTLVTDFTLLRAGALHRANGGYLIVEAEDLLRTGLAWEALKKAIKTRAVRIEDPLEEYRLASIVGLAPQPVPLTVKVVLIGSPMTYYLLCALDPDFSELFKVKVDFDGSMARTPEYEGLCARFVGSVCREEQLRHFASDGVAKLLEHSSRLVADQGRLSARLGDLLDTVREAAFWAEQAGRPLVTGTDVQRAVAERVHRADLAQERFAQLLADGTLAIATEGEVVGQVNGIAVIDLGEHAFGRPVRITARTYSGEPGVVDIEREAKLGGRIHSKGVLILTGFVAGRFARELPLALAASLTFEQQYEEVDGDSASSAELYALLSSVAGIPLRQDIAVTGAVNQHGEILPVGAINAKVEGFFDACRVRGLTGRQGVMIPAPNARHLMLREDVVEAVRAARFHVWTVTSVDEGLELLTGRPAGAPDAAGHYPEASVNGAVVRTLAASVERLRQLRAPAALDGHAVPAVAPGGSR